MMNNKVFSRKQIQYVDKIPFKSNSENLVYVSSSFKTIQAKWN